MVVDCPLHSVAGEAVTLTVGLGFTVTTTLLVAVQPELVTVTVYVVVAVGLALGFAVVELNPAGLLDHEYVYPPAPPVPVGEPPRFVVAPLQIARALPASAASGVDPVTVTDTDPLTVQPFASVTVTIYVVFAVGLCVWEAPEPLFHA